VKYYVYELVDPRSGAVFYVGKGSRSRIDQHEKEARKGRQSRKCDAIRAIESSGLSILKRKVAHFADEQGALDHEADLIGEYGLANLTNVALGGGRAGQQATLYSDRALTKVVSQFIWHTRNGAITTVDICGRPMDLSDIFKLYVGWLREIIKRRGYEWVNAISRRQNVIVSTGA